MTSQEKVVYLFGAGATQAELSRKGKENLVTMRAINERLFDEKLKDKNIKEYFANVDSKDLNVEHIISLFESFDNKKFLDLARTLRTLFQEDLLTNIIFNGKYPDPEITIALLEMHRNAEVQEKEKLHGIISLNYDSMLDIAFEHVYGGINYGIKCVSRKYTITNEVPLLLKLHGAFNWKYGSPIYVTESPTFLNKKSSLWIAPSIAKKTGNYPFNHIWGRAYEILDCDVLRIVGCSLNQNDWTLLSLIFKSQFNHKKAFSIEVIDDPSVVIEIKNRYAFIKNIKSIEKLDFDVEVVGDKVNFFELWLKEKLNSLFKSLKKNENKDELNNIIRKLNHEI